MQKLPRLYACILQIGSLAVSILYNHASRIYPQVNCRTCTSYTVQCTLLYKYIIQCTPNIVRSMMNAVHYVVYTAYMWCTLYADVVHCTSYNIRRTLYNVVRKHRVVYE